MLSFVEDAEAVKTFNMGWGWVAVVPAVMADAAAGCHPGAQVIGEVDSSGEVKVEVAS